MQAAALLKENKRPSRAQIVQWMNGNLCRCGTYGRIVRAIQRAAGVSGSSSSVAPTSREA
jgi:isoquinoline 1-oxidoreductase alpha subunit